MKKKATYSQFSGNRDDGHSQIFYRNLKRKMDFIIIFVSLAPLILVSGVILHQFHVFSKEKIYAYLEKVVRTRKQDIDSFLEEKLGNIRFLASTHNFEQLIREDFLQDQLAMLQQNVGPVFVDLGVVDSSGNQVSYAGPFKLGSARYSDAEWFKRAMEKEYFISDVFLGIRGLPHFIVSVRMDCEDECWILRSTIDFVAFNTMVENVRIGKTGAAFILNKKGEFQTKPGFDVVLGDEVYKLLLHDKEHDSNKSRIDDRGDSKTGNIYVSTFLKNGDWILIYQQSKKDAFSDLYRAQQVAVMIVLLGGFCIVTMAILVSRRMVRAIAVADFEKEIMNQQIVETGKLASIGELAAGIAHEINNPVAIMVEEAGWIQDLLEEEEFRGSQNLDEFTRALNQINAQGKRCKDITHKLLSFARRTDAQVQPFDINELIEEVVELSAQRAKYGKVEIRTHPGKNLPPLDASKSEFQQVFLNLINNALDAMEKTGGIITIRSRVHADDLVITVADTGPGIHETNLPRIFDPFFTTKPVGKGTGLGLSICYGIIKKLNGKIEVESAIGKGTTFYIRIPLDLSKQNKTV